MSFRLSFEKELDQLMPVRADIFPVLDDNIFHCQLNFTQITNERISFVEEEDSNSYFIFSHISISKDLRVNYCTQER